MNETKEKSSQISLGSVLRAIGFYGAEGRTRTDMVLLPLDFESSASANFTTSANYAAAIAVCNSNLSIIQSFVSISFYIF